MDNQVNQNQSFNFQVEQPEKKCANCGAVLSPEQAFCASCGTPVPKLESPTVCSNCGNKLQEGQSFCPSCGHKVGDLSLEPAIDQSKASKPNKKKKTIIIAVGVIVAIIALIVALSGNSVGEGGTPVEEVVLSESQIELKIDESEIVSYTISPSDASNSNVSWSSSNTSIATVDNFGKITAKGEGSCTITITAGKKSDSLTVTVKAGPDLKALYDEFCSSIWAELGSDNSYLYVDTNPYNYDDGDSRYIYTVNDAIESINKKMGLPESLYNDMNQTSWSMGKQEEVFESVGIKVSWTYHPDKGLEVTYKLIKN